MARSEGRVSRPLRDPGGSPPRQCSTIRHGSTITRLTITIPACRYGHAPVGAIEGSSTSNGEVRRSGVSAFAGAAGGGRGYPYPQHSPYPSNYPRPPPAAPAKAETPDLLTSPFEVELPSAFRSASFSGFGGIGGAGPVGAIEGSSTSNGEVRRHGSTITRLTITIPACRYGHATG
jgi:hypothetical protein